MENRKRKIPEQPEIHFSKLPPQAVDIEEAVLAAILIEKDALPLVVDSLKVETFYREIHQRIYQAIISLFASSSPIEILTVSQQLRTTGELELIGGPGYLMELTGKANASTNIEYHAKILIQMEIKRRMISIGADLQRRGYDDSTDAFELLDAGQQDIFKLSEGVVRKGHITIKKGISMQLSEMDSKRHMQDGVIGVPSGFSKLDDITGGWQRGELAILAARPGMGKTAFVVSSLRNAAVDFEKPVAIFSLEMSSLQLVARLISAEAEIDNEKIRKASLTPGEWEQLHHRIHRLSNSPLYIDDTPALSVLELRAKARRLKAQYDIQMIVIDYLQLMSGDSGSKKGPGTREQEISFISRSLKNLAKELDIPVIALSQLSRSVETRGGDKRPQLSDLRESGAIEQDADLVIFLYRPEYYGIMEDEGGAPTVGTGEAIIAKNRSGKLETAKMRFIGKYTKFAEMDHTSVSQIDMFSNRKVGIDTPIQSFDSKKNPSIGIFDVQDEDGDVKPLF